MSEVQEKPRDAKAVRRARCALLRDAVTKALSISAHYSDTAITFAQIGDDDCLELAMRGFASSASIAAKSARELIDLRRNGSSA